MWPNLARTGLQKYAACRQRSLPCYRSAKLWRNLGPILARFLHRWSIVGIWVLFWFILWLQYLPFSEARFGSPLVELFKVLFWFISARVWLKIMAQFTFWPER